jgi:hypothetical protein
LSAVLRLLAVAPLRRVATPGSQPVPRAARRVWARRAHCGVAALAQATSLSGALRLALHPFSSKRDPETSS